jgi:cyclic pyranopterin phosphate synthase
MSSPPRLTDSFGRVMRDLRVSVTDRCNYRCLYCLPETEEAASFPRSSGEPEARSGEGRASARAWLPKQELLTFEEIARVVRLAAELGIAKVRLTGGEPLVRQGLEVLVAKLSRIPGVQDLALTSNGFRFAPLARRLRAAGLQRVTFSLDSLDPHTFRRITGRDGLQEVLASLALAQELGLQPVKINAVIIRGLNDHELEPLADFARVNRFPLRFVEFMPLDASRLWQPSRVVPAREILGRLQARYPLHPVLPSHPSETARRWTFADGGGEVGLIAPVSEPFCGRCSRIRLTADGKLRTCLFSVEDHDLKPLLRGGAPDPVIQQRLQAIVAHKEERHHIGETGFVTPDRSMSRIGG